MTAQSHHVDGIGNYDASPMANRDLGRSPNLNDTDASASNLNFIAQQLQSNESYV